METYVLNKPKNRKSMVRKNVNKSKVSKKTFGMHNNKENSKPPCNLAASLDSEGKIKSVPETPRKAKKNRVSGCDIRLHQTIKSNNKNGKKTNKTKGIIVHEKTSTPIIAVKQPTTSGEAANIASISLSPNIDNTQQPIFGERDIEDIMAFIDEESWKSKVRADKELWDSKIEETAKQVSTCMGDNTILDLLDINMDHFEEMVGGALPIQNNEEPYEPAIRPIDNAQQSVQINDNQKTFEAVCNTNNQITEQQHSTIDMALFQELMADTNPIELPARNQIIHPIIEDRASDNICKSVPLGVKKQPEECLGVNDPDFASPVKSKENPYIVYKEANKKSPIVGGQRTLKRLQRASDNRRLDNIKKFNISAENRWYEELFKTMLESITQNQTAQGIMLPELRKMIKSGMLYSVI
ncbi:unnamed protein product [Rotaria socialis]|uniref:Uncharacterized protein n=2 Tax=Rotaria socialis TaxID=392032 RepID=A0A821W8G8_9BILA|nr:unnamed protein product [Rotaria socialis]